MPHSPRKDSNYWSPEFERSLRIIHDYCAGYSWMYSRDIQVYTKYSYYLSGAIFSLSALASLLNTIQTSFSINSKVFDVIVAIVSWLTVTFFTASYIKDYSAVIKELNNHKAEYVDLAGTIDRQLQLPPEERENVEDFHRWISSYYQLLGRWSFEILPRTVEQYRVHAQKENVPFPDELIDSSSKRLTQKENEKKIDLLIDKVIANQEQKEEKKEEKKGTLRDKDKKVNLYQIQYELERLRGHAD